MVGTGRFELPNGSPTARTPRRRCWCRAQGRMTDLGARGSARNCRLVHEQMRFEERLMVGTGRFELPTPRTPSEGFSFA